MTEKIVVQVNREAADIELEAAAAKQEKRRKKFVNKSYWPLIIKGPLATLIYGMFVYPRVFFEHIIMENPLYSLSIYQETIVRTLKWTMEDSSLKTMRKSASLLESLFKTFRCSEPFRATKIGGMKGYWLGPVNYKQKESEATILYLHGGGYVALSSLFGIRPLCYLLRHLRKKYNKHIRVLAIDYTLAPEGPFPTGLNCAERIYRWLVKSDIAGSKNVFLCGDSAGGGLVLALLQKLYPVTAETSDDIPLPLGVILISPWVELSCDSLSYFTNAEFDWISGHLTQLAAESYIFGKEGNPARKRNQILQSPPKIDKDVIMDWLEKVESNFDIDIEGVESNDSHFKRFSIDELNKGLSSYSLDSNKRHSGVKARKRGSRGAKRRSRVRDEKIIVQAHNPGKREEIKKLHESNIYIKDENPYRDPLISPLHIPHHILAKFPPLFISYGGKEIFRDDIEMFTRKCIESKKAYTSFDNNNDDDALDGQHPDIIVELNEDMIHDYPFVIDAFGKHSKKALDRIVPFIANRIPIPISNVPPRIRSSSLRMKKSRSLTELAIKLSASSLSVNSSTDTSSSRISSRMSNAIPNSRRIPISKSRSYSHLPLPKSRLSRSYSHLPLPNSRLSRSYSHLPLHKSYSHLPLPNSRLSHSYSHLPLHKSYSHLSLPNNI